MRRPIDGMGAGVMLVLCVAWASQQVAIKLAIDDIDPLMQVATRSGIAAALVWAFARCLLKQRWQPGLALRSGVLVGGLFAVNFLLIAEGLRWTTASHLTVFLYTAPLFSSIFLHFSIAEERLTMRQWSGMALAFGGIAITFLSPRAGATGGTESTLFGDALGLCSGLVWGLTTVAVRLTRLSEAPPAQTLFYQLTCAFLLLLPIAFFSGQSAFKVTAVSITSLGYQAVFLSFITYLIWLWLLGKYLAAGLGVMLFLAPLFGVMMGVVILDERLSLEFIFGTLVTIVGVVVVNVAAHGASKRLAARTITPADEL